MIPLQRGPLAGEGVSERRGEPRRRALASEDDYRLDEVCGLVLHQPESLLHVFEALEAMGDQAGDVELAQGHQTGQLLHSQASARRGARGPEASSETSTTWATAST